MPANNGDTLPAYVLLMSDDPELLELKAMVDQVMPGGERSPAFALGVILEIAKQNLQGRLREAEADRHEVLASGGPPY